MHYFNAKTPSLSSLLFRPFFFLRQQHRIHALSSSFSFTAHGAASPSRPLLSQFSIFVCLYLCLLSSSLSPTLSLFVSYVYQELKRKGKRNERNNDMGKSGFNFWVLLIFVLGRIVMGGRNF
jgi:hypothetical protein